MKGHLVLFLVAVSMISPLSAWSSASYAAAYAMLWAKIHPDSSVVGNQGSSHGKCDILGKQGDFTHYILSEAYPATSCQSDKKFKCSYPKNVTSWIIHGLWPSRDKQKGPTCCDPSAGFDIDSIQSLVPRLVKEWTNLKPKHGFYHFWSHEWTMHGTCCPDSLQPEYNYFNSTLTLFEEKFNFGKILSKAGIQPSNYYTAGKIIAAFGQGVVSEIKCSKINNKATLTEIRICLSKNFEATQCSGGGGGRFGRSKKKYPKIAMPCGKGSKIFYAPAHDQ